MTASNSYTKSDIHSKINFRMNFGVKAYGPFARLNRFQMGLREWGSASLQFAKENPIAIDFYSRMKKERAFAHKF